MPRSLPGARPIYLSVMDGWWAEAFDGMNGFGIGKGRTHSNMHVHDSRDRDDLYRVLREEVIPLYYQRDQDGLPRGWIQRMKRTIRTLGWRFNADRMVMDYATFPTRRSSDLSVSNGRMVGRGIRWYERLRNRQG